jgi:hypothetical protein
MKINDVPIEPILLIKKVLKTLPNDEVKTLIEFVEMVKLPYKTVHQTLDRLPRSNYIKRKRVIYVGNEVAIKALNKKLGMYEN